MAGQIGGIQMIPLLFVLHPHKHGYRWALMRATEDELLAEPTRRCVNAGFSDTLEHADIVGQIALYSVLSFAATVGMSCKVTALTLGHDPLPSQSDQELFEGIAIVGDGQVLQIGAN